MEKLLVWLRTLKAETVFTVIAGCWVLFGYFSHEREARHLQVEQQRLATDQARAVQQTAIETSRAHLQQLKLSNDLQTRTVDDGRPAAVGAGPNPSRARCR